MCNTEGCPAGLRESFGRLNGGKIHLANVVGLVPLGALGPEAPEPSLEHQIPVWVILRLRFCIEDIVEEMEIDNISLHVCIKKITLLIIVVKVTPYIN